MLTTKQFIEKTKNNLFKSYLTLETCKYKFDVLTDTHYFLIPKWVYSDKRFVEFDFHVTNEAYDLGIQGLICFTTDEKVFNFEEHDTFYNHFNNDALLKNLAYIIDPAEFYSVGFKISGMNLTFSTAPETPGMEMGGESNYAIAA